MQIDHDPNEGRKYPNYGEKQWAQEKHGRPANPRDLLNYIWPIACVAVALFLWRNGWPF